MAEEHQTKMNDSDLASIFDSEDDPRLIAEAFQEAFFDKADEEDGEECPHKDIERWVDGRGYCITCGETFTDASDVNSAIKNCKHENARNDDTGVIVCTQCGLELDTLDFDQEWRWYGTSDNRFSRDPSRCHSKRSSAPGVKTVFNAHNVEISPVMLNLVEKKYQKVLQNEGNKVCRGQGRESIVASCLFHVYQEFGEFRTAIYIRELFDIKQKNMSMGLTKYLKAFPEARTNHITPEKLLPWIMKLTGIDRSHYRRIRAITRYVSAASTLVERSNPQSVAAAIVFFYLCLNPEYKNELGMTKSVFASKAKLSDITVTKIVKEITAISREAIAM